MGQAHESWRVYASFRYKPLKKGSTNQPEKVKPKLKGKRSHGSQEHDGDAKVEDDQEELGLLAVALEVSSGRLAIKSTPLMAEYLVWFSRPRFRFGGKLREQGPLAVRAFSSWPNLTSTRTKARMARRSIMSRIWVNNIHWIWKYMQIIFLPNPTSSSGWKSIAATLMRLSIRLLDERVPTTEGGGLSSKSCWSDFKSKTIILANYLEMTKTLRCAEM